MDTLKIKAVLLAAKCKSLSKAAEEFAYTPSALSHSVDSLEKLLGVKLLDRSHSGVELSEAGALLLEKLSAVVAAENDLLQSAAALSTSKHNQLRIGTYSSISVRLMPKILTGFKERYPQIGVSITVGNRIGDWLDAGIADVLFGVENEGHQWIPLIKDDFVAVVPDSIFCGRKAICFEELYPYSFIVTENLAVVRSVDLNRFRERIVLSSEDDMSAVSMVQEGMGVTILPALVLKKRTRGIRILKLKPRLYRSLGISYKKECGDSSVVMKFVQYLKEIYGCTPQP